MLEDALRRRVRLARWLAPTAGASTSPQGVVRSTVTVPHASPFRATTFARRAPAPTGSVLVVPGLHPDGPDDPRLDRFCRVLAHAGLFVLAPCLPSYRSLEIRPAVVDETEAALDALLAHPERPRVPPSVFSISFGSMPALRVADRRGDALRRLVVFGGFARFRRTMRFALVGDGTRPNDPLNAPVVVQNLLAHLEPAVTGDDAERLRALWRAYCGETWGRGHTKSPDVFGPIARRLAGGLPPHLSPLLLASCRVEPGVEELAFAALDRAAGAMDWIDPLPHIARIACPVVLVHGRDDDVIPHDESAALAEGLRARAPSVALHLTGLYGHTGGAGVAELAGNLRAAAREGVTLLRVLDALAGL